MRRLLALIIIAILLMLASADARCSVKGGTLVQTMHGLVCLASEVYQ